MVVDADERRIRVAFRALRASDGRSAPPFARILSRRAPAPPRPWAPGVQLAVDVLAIGAALGLVLWFSISPGGVSSVTAPDSASVAGAWSSPTAFLLRPVDTHVFIAVPAVTDSIVNRLLDGREDNTRGGVR